VAGTGYTGSRSVHRDIEGEVIMGFSSKTKNSAANADAKEAEHKPSATFWDDPTPAKSSGKYSKVEQSEHTFGMNYDPSLELQTSIGGSSREYGQAAANASATNNEQPQNRPRIGHGRKTKAEMLAGDNRTMFSTHRAALGMLNGPTEEERLSLVERAERKAWSSFTAMLELFAR
jgi:hypothetical protein